MNLKPGIILKNLIPTESVKIDKVQEMGNMISINYTGVNSKKVSSKIIDINQVEQLEMVSQEGKFDFSGDPVRFSLYAEAERINSAYQFDPLFAVNCSVVDPLPHQIEAVYKYLLPLPKIRFLLADDTGAGKTIMTGLLLKEMLLRDLVKRILIITPGGLTKQWQQDELSLKFNLSFRLADRPAFNSDPNIFSNSDRIITSIDFLRGEDVLNVISDTSWDIIIVDEAHKLSAFDYGNKRYVTKRYQALETLSKKCDHLLLLTATPHRGRKDTFKNLLQLLDEDIFASDQLVTSRINELGEKGVNKFFIRRLKEEMLDWDNNPLFKDRYTKTTLYNLTPEEKKLYDKVSDYLLRKREEAKEQSNIHVSLALMVMQRRLTSSIYAIKRTLENRYKALKGLLDELSQNPNLWSQRQKLELEMETLDDFDEFDDEERETLEKIMADPKKFKLFTTAKSPGEIREEANQVKYLVELAEKLYLSNQEEQKFIKLKELLKSNDVLDNNEKLVIFTEHKDTLIYLKGRLENNGYSVSTIHGGKNVDERRDAQVEFANRSQILIATDAAGEGINLQFCRLLINWDIPWNPNRLEQRMGRIHRYGQKEDVLVFNLVAQNTREGQVLKRILTKLDVIREQMGDDRVYDVISEVFEGVSLDEIINSTFSGKSTSYDKVIEEGLTTDNIRKKIHDQKERIGHSSVDYKEARLLKELSDERRLQPIYVKLFFEKAYKHLGGEFKEENKSIFRIQSLPPLIKKKLKEEYNLSLDINNLLFCFDKGVFLEFKPANPKEHVHFINPGNSLFDGLIRVILEEYREDMLRGAVFISPDDKEEYVAYFVKSQILDNRPHSQHESVADEKLVMVFRGKEGGFKSTSPAKFIDLKPPADFTKNINTPDTIEDEEVVSWSFSNITQPQFQKTQERVHKDTDKRKEYLEESFNNIVIDLNNEINDLQGKILFGDKKAEEKISKKLRQIDELKHRKEERIRNLDLMQELNMKAPEVIGCAYIFPLSRLEYESHFGMSRDDEAEAIAMEKAMDFERSQNRIPEDVSSENLGYDIRSSTNELLKRYIEVKGRSADGGIMLSENEMNRLAQLGESAWLYIVINCKSDPRLYRINDPVKNMNFLKKTKGVQFFLPPEEWKAKAGEEKVES